MGFSIRSGRCLRRSLCTRRRKLVITYELPPPDCVATEFDIKATISNRGFGPARNLRFNSAQPSIVENASNLQIGFSIVEALVNGQSQGSSLNLQLGVLMPLHKVEVVWRLKSTLPGRFVEFTSDYRQYSYQNLPLTPLISEINTVFADYSTLSATQCKPFSNNSSKPPLLIVHGIQTMSILGIWTHPWDVDSTGYSCSQGVEVFNGANSTLGALPFWLTEHYNVWIAHLDSRALGSKDGTPSILDNSKCLRDQINTMYSQLTEQQKLRKITIVAHSMGGLVSRACITNPQCGTKVRALYTLGSPHGGLIWDYVVELVDILTLQAEQQFGLTDGGLLSDLADESLSNVEKRVKLCENQRGLCDMDVVKMAKFNFWNANQHSLDKYVFIGGGGIDTPLSYVPGLKGAYDGLVLNKSAVGWMPPGDQFVPWNWTSNSSAFNAILDRRGTSICVRCLGSFLWRFCTTAGQKLYLLRFEASIRRWHDRRPQPIVRLYRL